MLYYMMIMPWSCHDAAMVSMNHYDYIMSYYSMFVMFDHGCQPGTEIVGQFFTWKPPTKMLFTKFYTNTINYAKVSIYAAISYLYFTRLVYHQIDLSKIYPSFKILYLTKHFLTDIGRFIINFPCLSFVCCCDVFQVSSKSFIKLGFVVVCFRNFLANEK